MCGADLDVSPRWHWRPGLRWSDLAFLGVLFIVALLWRVRLFTPEANALGRMPIPTGTTIPAPTATPTETSTPTPIPTVTPTPTPIYHKVQPGETLLTIAGLYESSVEAIIKANGLGEQGFIYAGQTLLVPPPTPPLGPDGKPLPTSTPTPKTGTLVYVVKEGDTLSLVSGRFEVPLAALMQANNLEANDFIHPGQVLLVPLGTATPEATTPRPTPTPTPGPPWPAPALLSPPDGAWIEAKSDILLCWAAVGTLAEDEWYVLRIWEEDSRIEPLQILTKGTSWRLSPELRFTDGGAPLQLRWQVALVQIDEARSRMAQRYWTAISPPSAIRRLNWR